MKIYSLRLLLLIPVFWILVTTLIVNSAYAAASEDFLDISQDTRHYESINRLYEEAIIGGYDDQTFRPHDNLKRIDVAVMLFESLDMNLDDNANNTFSDVPPRAKGEVAALKNAGIIDGYNETTFGSQDTVTRAQVAKFITLAFNLDMDVADQGYKDIDLTSSLAEYVNALGAAEIASGYDDGRFGVNDDVKRGDFAAFLSRAIEKQASSPSEPENDDSESQDESDDDSESSQDTGDKNNSSNEQQDDDTTQVTEDDDTRTAMTNEEIINEVNSQVVMIEGETSLGSGVIVGDGLILTNHHVIDDMEEATVQTADGQSLTVEGVVAQDDVADLALIKTRQHPDLPSSILGQYSEIDVNERAVAIGSPKGNFNTSSTGLISGMRDVQHRLELRTTAEIDEGSSGGGLFNRFGQLVGITTGVYYNSYSDEVFYFAVAIDEAFQWSHYFDMPFDDVPIIRGFGNTSNHVIDGGQFGNVQMGMTREEVRQVVTDDLFKVTEQELFYTNMTYYDLSVQVIYTFDEQNKLRQIFIDFAGANQVTMSELEEAFYYLMNNLEQDFGQSPSRLDTNWYNDPNQTYILSALWDVANSTELRATIDDQTGEASLIINSIDQ